MFELKTIAFEFDTMKRLIDYGDPIIIDCIFKGFDREANPSNLSMGVWLEFVPYEFKDIANRAIIDIHDKFMYTMADEQTRLAIITRMLSFIRREMYEQDLLSDGGIYALPGRTLTKEDIDNLFAHIEKESLEEWKCKGYLCSRQTRLKK